MREYLFRGKGIDNGEWVYGDLWCNPYGKRKVCIVSPINDQGTTGGNAVNPETVGQYTGMLDKNGTKIFEGDICNFSNRSDIDNYGVVVYDADETEFGIDYGSTYLGLGRHYHSRDVEVIGNIYDNPELLKE
jgi:uncharacterized phage protein (TIGR01671 family)